MFWFRLYDKKVIQIVLRKRKNCLLCNIQIIAIASFSSWDQVQIGIKLGTNPVILKVCKFYIEKGYLC